MSTQFNILRYSHGHVLSQETARRKDHAHGKAWDAVYQMMDGNGLRDRPVAWRMVREVSEWLASYRPGSEGKHIFRLDDDQYVYLDWSRMDARS